HHETVFYIKPLRPVQLIDGGIQIIFIRIASAIDSPENTGGNPALQISPVTGQHFAAEPGTAVSSFYITRAEGFQFADQQSLEAAWACRKKLVQVVSFSWLPRNRR